MTRIVILGAGAMGLAAAQRAVTLGAEVELIEADREPGGMAAHLDLGGASIERFYHFVCKSDAPTFALLRELGLPDAMRWVPTSMAYFMRGGLHRWGDPMSLLRFPHLSWGAKFRTGLQMFLTTRQNDFASIERLTARQWIEVGSGREVYETLWKRLLGLKFYEHADHVSASWIATRVRRIGRSRRSIFQEELGYIEGGSQTLVDALMRDIAAKGGRVALGEPAAQVLTEEGRVTGVRTATGRDVSADQVISTVPTPLIPRLVPDLPEALRAQYAAIENIGVCCVLLRLKRSVTPHFWVNIVDDEIPIPGIIEFSNLRAAAGEDAIVYVPYYMPVTEPRWSWSDEELIAESLACIARVNPAVTRADLVEARVGRLRHAQPVCGPNFLDTLPPVRTPIAGLQIADTCFYYPEDRGIAESVRLGREMAEHACG
jgi:protoporphyrinogen oxidase